MNYVVINQEFSYDPLKANILYVGENKEKALNIYRDEIGGGERNYLQVWENEELKREFELYKRQIRTPLTEEELRLQNESLYRHLGNTLATGCMPEYRVSYKIEDSSVEYFSNPEYL